MGSEITPQATDRLFFAIFPEASIAARIAALAHTLRDQHGLKGRPIATERLHVTLQHVGDYAGPPPPSVIAAAIAAGAALRLAPLDVSFDRVMSFHNRTARRPFVLCGSDGSEQLKAAQRAVSMALIKAGLKPGPLGRTDPTPHMTLLYDDRLVPEQTVDLIPWTAYEGVLVHSLLGKTQHISLARWPFSG